MILKKKIDKGYWIYLIPNKDQLELRKCGAFGNKCDQCNKIIDEVVYIPVLNFGMCMDCYIEWEKRCIFYEEDQNFEFEKCLEFEYLCHKLNLYICK